MAHRLIACTPVSRWILIMSAQVSQQEVKFPRVFNPHRQIAGGASQLAISAVVNADRYRIFQALTVPEYMEAWLCLPGDARHQVSALRNTNGYRIEFRGPLAHGVSVAGTYMVFRRSKVVFTWQKDTGDAQPSFVLIRLHGEFSRTRLCLYHIGLRSQEDHQWHQTMWESSLAALSSLFKQGTNGF